MKIIYLEGNFIAKTKTIRWNIKYYIICYWKRYWYCL